MFAMNSILLAGAVAAIVQAGPASQPASEMPNEDRRAVELFVEEAVRAFEEALTRTGATDAQRRYLYCLNFADHSVFAMPGVPWASSRDLFPEIVRSVEANAELSDLHAEFFRIRFDVSPGVVESFVEEVAERAAPVEIDLGNCRDSMLPSLTGLQGYVERMNRCTEYLTEGLTPIEQPSMLDCPYADLAIPPYVEAYQAAISTAANNLLVGQQLPQGFHIVEAEASGVLSRSSEHCGVGAIRIDVANEEGMEAALFIETAYAVHSQRDASLAVSFPETEMPLIQFCAERGFELSGEAEITSAKLPLEAFSDVLREALARRE